MLKFTRRVWVPAVWVLLGCGGDAATSTANAGNGAQQASSSAAGVMMTSAEPAKPAAATAGHAATRAAAGGGGVNAAASAGTAPSSTISGSGGVSAAVGSSGASALAGTTAAGSGASGAAAVGGANAAGTAGPPMTGPATGTFPAIKDPWMAGPFAVAMMGGAGPSRNATVLYPRELGKDGLKHPIIVWDNGAGQTGLSIYGSLLNHLASHGFAVYAAYSATDGGKELVDGLDWMIAQAAESGSPFFEKLDITKVAAMGHSQGSIATFAIAADPRLTTTLHLSGGTNPDIAEGHATLPNLHHPAAFLCGETGGDGLTVGDAASEWCAYDFEHTDVPVFLVQIQGASHISAPGMTSGACAAWLRWQLMADTTMRMQFAGDDCVLCMRQNWKTMTKGL